MREGRVGVPGGFVEIKVFLLQRHRWLRRVVGLGCGLLVLGWLVVLALPPLLKYQVQKAGSEAIGRRVTLGAVSFQPWSGVLTLSDIAVATADGRADQLHIKRMALDVSAQSLWQSLRYLAPVVDALVVDEPVVHLTRLAAGHYDIDDVWRKLAHTDTPAPPPSAPAQFALHNLKLTRGSITFTDGPVQRTHTLSQLDVALPFLSNLTAQRAVRTDLRVAFNLNGSRFDSAVQTLPFMQARATQASFKWTGVDVQPYVGYLPASLPVQLVAGVLDADVQLDFAQQAAPTISLHGWLQAQHVQLADAKQQDLLAFDRLRVDIKHLRPLAQSVHLAEVAWTGPVLQVHRQRDGHLNLDLAATTAAPSVAPAAPAASAASAASGASGATVAQPAHTAPSPAWDVALDKLQVRAGRVNWVDEAMPAATPARISLGELTLDATALAWPKRPATMQAVPFRGSAVVLRDPAGGGPQGPASVQQAQNAPAKPAVQTPGPVPEGAGASLSFSGAASSSSATVTATLHALPLQVVAPYLAQFLEPRLSGQLDVVGGLQWQAAQPQDGSATASGGSLIVQLDQLAADQLALTQGARTLAALRKLELGPVRVDTGARSIRVGQLKLSRPQLALARQADGHWMFERWLKHARATSPAQPAALPVVSSVVSSAVPSARRPLAARQASAAPATPVPPAWQIAMSDIVLDGGRLDWADAAAPTPVALTLTELQLRLRNLALGAAPGLTSAPAMAVELAAKVSSGGGEPGRLSYRGSLGLSPMQTQGRVDLVRLPLHALEPYFGDALNLDLLRADTSFQGQVSYTATPAGPRVRVQGGGAIEDFHADAVVASIPSTTTTTPTLTSTPIQPRARWGLGSELVSWKALSVQGVSLALTPGSATTVDVGTTTLSDFFARIILQPNGRLNLQDLVKHAAPADTASGSGVAGVGAAAAPSVSAASAPAPVIRAGAINLLNGKVYFTDRFIKPNYSANLTELTGSLGPFSSVVAAGTPTLADVELHGRAESTASLEIRGKFNPLVQPPVLNIQGKVRDLELPPLSPYSIKYAGHGIERGKLSLDVGYTIEPDGHLTATNQLVLNQISFGDPVAGAPTSLPVKLAVALLADSRGVIDLNLPISGSLNDPQFRLGPVIFKAVVNLIGKALLSPFTLLSSALGGGGDELSQVSFAPGSASLSPQAMQSLNRVAQALSQRPALHMTVVGQAQLEAEREGYRRARLQALVQAEKRRQQVLGGAGPSLVSRALAVNAKSHTPGTATSVVTPALPAASTPALAPAVATTAAPASAEDGTITAQEYPALLKAVYQRADVPKPRNLIGIAKDLPVPEMEALLLAHIPVSEERMRELATQRGVVVRDYLAFHPANPVKLPLDRLFLGAPKTATPSSATEAAPAWQPRAELQLSAH
jgi:hypothetical protein